MAAIIGMPTDSMFAIVAYVGTPPLAVFAVALIGADLLDMYRKTGTVIPPAVRSFARRRLSRGRTVFARNPAKGLLHRHAG